MVSLTEVGEASSSSDPPSTSYNHRYKYDIPTGEFLKPELESAIKASRASVIVLSENYASSTWCLEELALILDQKNNSNQIVIPVFYHVEPTHVRKQQSSFGEAMEKHKLKMEAETNVEEKGRLGERMKRWKDALTQVSDLRGKDAQGRLETTLIEEIVDELYKRLGLPLGTTTLPQLIGMEYHIKRISSWLKDGSKHTADILTIWGMGGIGKTSLAKYVYELHRHAYTSYSFIEDISRRCTGTHGLLKLQKQLYGDISKRKLTRVHNVSEYTSIICKAIAHEEVLVILDDINSYDQLDQLLGDKGFHPGSKIIITTKDASLIERCALFKTKGKPKHTKCILEGLSVSDSMELLCRHAFICNYPREGYEEVAEKLVRYCEGHPLALEVLGKSLHQRDVAYWEECIKGLKKEPLSGIEKVKKALQLSFDSLSSENDKELFKHIACFFVGEDRDLTETILKACDINTTSGITNLMEKCFLHIRWNNELSMHSLIQETGRDLVRQESLNKPWKRSRLWCHEESFDVLKRKKGTENILGLSLDMRMLDKKKWRGSFELKTESFSQMDNLMLLQLNNVQLNECFHNFPEELRWLCMHGFPSKSIHLDLPMENLVVLDMSRSNIESFDPQPPAKKQNLVGSCSKDEPLLGSLKILNLSFCEQLHSVGGFFELPALEKLIVKRCISLMEVCESVEQCVELVHIDLSYCHMLKKFPIGKLQTVQTLWLDGCNLSESAIMVDSSDLRITSQTSSSANREAIPHDFKFFITVFPSSLRFLSLANNNLSNESFPNDLSCLAMLEELCLDYNPIVSLPNCVRTFPSIQTLTMDHCDDLISVEHLPGTLREFSMVTDYDKSVKIRKIKFDQDMHPLILYGTPSVVELHLLVEIDGIIKIQPMADVEEKLLHSLGWKKSDFIEEGHLLNHDIKMIYEFGIFSTIYKGKGMLEWIKHRSWGQSISFIIPPSPKKLRGLNFCCVNWPPFTSACYFPGQKQTIKISNITKKQTWIYDHYTLVNGKEYFSSLSHWMFGPNEMKAGDNIKIECYVMEEEYEEEEEEEDEEEEEEEDEEEEDDDDDDEEC
ncbi:putative TIR domain, P-loop containing nucleoside triphosphate hydrolase [Helianthus annuus]|nr:putative TIR domain, P-loop containing nucleoside triphosphate hydrolase [Helianthus annuus]